MRLVPVWREGHEPLAAGGLWLLYPWRLIRTTSPGLKGGAPGGMTAGEMLQLDT